MATLIAIFTAIIGGIYALYKAYSLGKEKQEDKQWKDSYKELLGVNKRNQEFNNMSDTERTDWVRNSAKRTRKVRE